MISKELKNDFREMIFGTFCAGFEDVIYSWEKNHFLRKWAFPEMDGNHFFPENARQPPGNPYENWEKTPKKVEKKKQKNQ